MSKYRRALPQLGGRPFLSDGRLPTGDTLADAILRTDAETGGYAAYYMINCAHPTHIRHLFDDGGTWRDRIRGVRANASRRSHAELDESPDLDAGDPPELGAQYRELRALFPSLTVPRRTRRHGQQH